jgi:hypothetical protein
MRSWLSRLRLPQVRRTVPSAVADLGDRSENRRGGAAIWVWSRGHDRFSAEERHRLAAALRPVAEADPDPAARAQAIVALVALGVDSSVDLALAALRDPDRGCGPSWPPRSVRPAIDGSSTHSLPCRRTRTATCGKQRRSGSRRRVIPARWSRCEPWSAGNARTPSPKRAPSAQACWRNGPGRVHHRTTGTDHPGTQERTRRVRRDVLRVST